MSASTKTPTSSPQKQANKKRKTNALNAVSVKKQAYWVLSIVYSDADDPPVDIYQPRIFTHKALAEQALKRFIRRRLFDDCNNVCTTHKTCAYCKDLWSKTLYELKDLISLDVNEDESPHWTFDISEAEVDFVSVQDKVDEEDEKKEDEDEEDSDDEEVEEK